MIVLSSTLHESYGGADNPDSPERLRNVHESLSDNSVARVTLKERDASEDELLLIHSPEHLFRLKNSIQEDTNCPAYPNMYKYASLAAGMALESAKIALSGQHSFSLMRPPGHHASRDKSMGLCYINNAALATVYIRNGGFGRVAILDIDNHHGNGTQEIISGLEDIIFVDLHRHPDYPNTGEDSNKNYINFQLQNRIGEKGYLTALDTALKSIKNFKPAILIVSAGFDTSNEDPIGNLGLEISSYFKIGQKLRELEILTCSILEGGYNPQALSKCIISYIRGLQ